jgi:transposase-like protein
MARKLTDEDVAAIAEAWRAGESAVDIAATFGVTQRHILRLVQQAEERSNLETMSGRAELVAQNLVDSLDLPPGDHQGRLMAETLVILGRRLDRASAHATPSLSVEFRRVAEELGSRRSGPSDLDLLRERRKARRVAAYGHP